MTDFFVSNAGQRQQLHVALDKMEMPYRVKVSKGGRRSLEQNAYLWGVVYPTVLTLTGLEEQGWEKSDLHEYFLGEHFGWNTLEGLPIKRRKPVDRSSTLTKMEFVDYVAFIQREAAQRWGIYIPDPEEK